MLYLTRKVGESVIINDTIELTVVEVRGKTAKLGFTFPPDATVLRKELHDRIKEENVAAAAVDVDVLGDFATGDVIGGETLATDGDSATKKDDA